VYAASRSSSDLTSAAALAEAAAAYRLHPPGAPIDARSHGRVAANLLTVADLSSKIARQRACGILACVFFAITARSASKCAWRRYRARDLMRRVRGNAMCEAAHAPAFAMASHPRLGARSAARSSFFAAAHLYDARLVAEILEFCDGRAWTAVRRLPNAATPYPPAVAAPDAGECCESAHAWARRARPGRWRPVPPMRAPAPARPCPDHSLRAPLLPPTGTREDDHDDDGRGGDAHFGADLEGST
jgi:hypothetical protein